MSTTPGAPDLEARLRAALAARADLVRGEDLTPLATVTPLRPRWSTPWVLLAAAAVVLLVLGVVLQGVGSRTRSDEVAPEPDAPRLELPADVGRGWEPATLSRSPRLDLDGDGTREKVDFLAEPTEGFDGRFRMQTTLSATGEEAYGIAKVGTTIDTNVLDPIDADGDGDQELVLYFDDPDAGPGGGGHPLVFDLRDGLLVQAVVEEPELLVRGQLVVEGSATDHYDLVRVANYWLEDGILRSSRSVGAYARGNMTLLTPRTYVIDAWTWTLGDDGVLRHGDAECLMQSFDSTRPCGADPLDTIMYFPVERASYLPAGETVDALEEQGYGFTARVDDGAEPTLVVEGYGRVIEQVLDVRDPLLGSVQPSSVFYDGASLVVTSAGDPSVFEVLVQDDDRMVVMEPVGEIDLVNDGEQRTWLTENGAVLSAIPDGDAWSLWTWTMVSRTEIAALPWGTVCIDDVDDPRSIRAC